MISQFPKAILFSKLKKDFKLKKDDRNYRDEEYNSYYDEEDDDDDEDEALLKVKMEPLLMFQDQRAEYKQVYYAAKKKDNDEQIEIMTIDPSS